jgi:hypothetical protein
MAKFETVPLAELTRLPAKLRPLVENYKEKLGKLDAAQGGKLVLEKGDDPKDLRKALKGAAPVAAGVTDRVWELRDLIA